MDKETRNLIQRATQAARALLEQEFGEQLEGVFDIQLDGTIAGEPGSHLDAAQRVVRTKLVAAIEHLSSSGQTIAEAVTGYLREAAFTTLNRFVALKMLEARGLVQECISRGEQSSGFKEFTGLAPGLIQLPNHGYRLYIESLFDEIGREVRVLFDRRDAGQPALAEAAGTARPARDPERVRSWLASLGPKTRPSAGSTSTSTATTSGSRCATRARRRATAASSPSATSSSPRATWSSFSPTTPWAASGTR